MFRVTCSRGGKHPFTTEEAARALAAGVQRLRPSWEACLVGFDLEVVAHVHFSTTSLGLSLTSGGRKRLQELQQWRQQQADPQQMEQQAQHARGATTLSADLSYGLLVAASLGSWDVLVDPMCGSNSIAETALKVGVKVLFGRRFRGSCDREDGAQCSLAPSMFSTPARHLPLGLSQTSVSRRCHRGLGDRHALWQANREHR
ncbi:unnamed protein product [Polarella glacialis]|uniref:THUMP domain-containing protein n=1 Tax=Polarella glacialis TaxID=89957 RepID=A0A813DDK5_POLGL|nr:unnamed protein product [Polarella glacialis]